MDKEISVTLYTDGITNRLIGCYLPEDKDNVILIRVYGEKTELFIDRNREKLNMKLMHEAGLAPPLFASFKNGLCYGFTPGKPIDYDRVRDPFICKFIADKMARMHSLVKPKRTPSFCAASGCPPNCSSPTSVPHPIPEACLFREEGGTLVKYLDLLRDCNFHSKGRRQSRLVLLFLLFIYYVYYCVVINMVPVSCFPFTVNFCFTERKINEKFHPGRDLSLKFPSSRPF